MPGQPWFACGFPANPAASAFSAKNTMESGDADFLETMQRDMRRHDKEMTELEQVEDPAVSAPNEPAEGCRRNRSGGVEPAGRWPTVSGIGAKRNSTS